MEDYEFYNNDDEIEKDDNENDNEEDNNDTINNNTNQLIKQQEEYDIKLEKLQLIYSEILEYEASQGYSLFKDHIPFNNFCQIINFKKRMTFATFIKFIHNIFISNNL